MAAPLCTRAEERDAGRLVASHRPRGARRTGRSAADARRLAPAQGAAHPPRLPAALQEHPRVVALHPHPLHDRAPPLRGGAHRGGLLLPESGMSFVVQRVTPRGLVVNQINVASLRIGRGTSAELRSENPAVSLEHAVIDEDAAGFTVTDKGSITGTYVNGKPVETARPAQGHVISIGQPKIEAQIADSGQALIVRIAPPAPVPV